MRRSFVIWGVALALVGMIGGPVSANTTVVTWTHDDYTFSIRECGFRVTFHAFGPYKYADQYTNGGVLYRTIVTSGGGGYHITATAHGITLETESSYQIITTYNRDGSVATTREDGLHFGFTVPGRGVVLLDTGRLDTDPETGQILFEGGPRMFLHDDFDTFCAAFG